MTEAQDKPTLFDLEGPMRDTDHAARLVYALVEGLSNDRAAPGRRVVEDEKYENVFFAVRVMLEKSAEAIRQWEAAFAASHTRP